MLGLGIAHLSMFNLRDYIVYWFKTVCICVVFDGENDMENVQYKKEKTKRREKYNSLC